MQLTCCACLLIVKVLKELKSREAQLMDLASAIVLLFTAVAFGYFGGKDHGFHKLLKSLGLDEKEK